jgi:DNA-binding FrmR family transcriptional regulator
MDGIERMIDEERYCLDIILQIKAAQSALKSLELKITEAHLDSCVRTAVQSKDKKEAETKLLEIKELLGLKGT